MTLKQLAIRTKSSISRLYSSNKDDASQYPVVFHSQTRPRTDRETDGVEESSASSSGNSSPEKASPSRCRRLLGSLRSVGSLRSLQSPRLHNDAQVKAETPCTPVREMPSLSLNFEVPPPGRPIFDTPSRKSFNCSSMEVHHSTPIAVPVSDRAPKSGPIPFQCDSLFPIGTPPESPAPFQCASVQVSILRASSPDKIGFESTKSSPARQDFATAAPTPMPGTNLTLEDIGPPEIIVQSPSAPSLLHSSSGDYFGVQVLDKDGQEQRESTVQSEPLLVDDSDFDEILAISRGIVTHGSHQSFPEKPVPVASSKTVVPDDEFHPDSCTGSPHEHTPSRDSSDSNGLRGTLAYIVWNDRASGEEEKVERERCPSARSVHTRLHDSGDMSFTSVHMGSTDNTENDKISTEWTDVGGRLVQVVDEETAGSKADVGVKEESSPIDDGEELRNIVSSYTGPMLYQMSLNLDDDLVAEEAYFIDEINDELKADFALSLRVMNRSLGG